jgi:hypothetical protein
MQNAKQEAMARRVAISVDGDSLVALDDLSNRYAVSRSEMSRKIIGNCATSIGQARLLQFCRDNGAQIEFKGLSHIVTFRWSSEVDESLTEVSKILWPSFKSANKSETFRMMVMLCAVEENVVKLEPIRRLGVRRVAPVPIGSD